MRDDTRALARRQRALQVVRQQLDDLPARQPWGAQLAHGPGSGIHRACMSPRGARALRVLTSAGCARLPPVPPVAIRPAPAGQGGRARARRRAAPRRGGGVRRARRALRGVAAARRAHVRARPRRRRGGRAGDVARGPQRDRPLRGPFLAEDVDLPDPQQPRQDARGARAAQRAVLRAGRRRRGRRGRRRRRSLPARGRPLGRQLGRRAVGLEPRARGAPARPRDARARVRGDPGAAAAPGRGARAARRRGLGARGGLRRPGYHRRKPAHPPAPRAQQGARRARTVFRRRTSRHDGASLLARGRRGHRKVGPAR